jgi:glycosyltransferase involved in cell wall biosynthesis
MPLPERWKEPLRPYYLKWLYFPLRPQARPAHWRACWSFPSQPLDRAAELAAMAPPAAGPDFLFLPMTDWHARTQRPQHLARALAASGCRVFYLNPNLGREYGRPAALARPRVAALEPGIFELHIPLPREPVFHHRLLAAGESARVAESCRRALEAFGIRQLAIVMSFPIWREAARALDAAVILYDCHDLLGGFTRVAPEIVAREGEALASADAVLFTADTLRAEALARWPDLAARSAVIRNGADERHFAAARRERAPRPRPLVGYAGSLDEWLDVAAIESAAAAHPQARFVLYGRIEDARVRVLERLSNVTLAGEVPYAALPGLMREWDAALIPFRITPLTLATNPIKLYEYFSAGLPVISTTLPEVAVYGDLVYLADSADQFRERLGAALAERDPQLARRRVEAAARESWTERAARILAIVRDRTTS